MPFNVLLLPLLGGYIFIANWNRTRFDTKRYSGERLIFHAAIAGVILLVISLSIVELIVWLKPDLATSWRKVVPFAYSGTSLLAFGLGSAGWWPLNRWFFKRPEQAKKTIERWNDFFEILLSRALTEARLVSVTLKSRKVYIGFVTGGLDPVNDRKYVVLLPMHSGYRDERTLGLTIQTNYAPVYARIIQEDNRAVLEGIGDFRLVIPVVEVQSLNLFDPTAYELFLST